MRKKASGIMSVQALGKYKDAPPVQFKAKHTPAAKFKKSFPAVVVTPVVEKKVKKVEKIEPVPEVVAPPPPPPKRIVRQCNFCQTLYYTFHNCQTSA
jgi:hypothetical protein